MFFYQTTNKNVRACLRGNGPALPRQKFPVQICGKEIRKRLQTHGFLQREGLILRQQRFRIRIPLRLCKYRGCETPPFGDWGRATQTQSELIEFQK
jgi:hypothetical protein